MADISCQVEVDEKTITISLGDYVVQMEPDQAQILSQALSLAKAIVEIRTEFRVLSIKIPVRRAEI